MNKSRTLNKSIPGEQKGCRRPLLIVVSAPSGAGKTTLCDRLLRETSGMIRSISCTTRAPRGKEKDGVDYIFLDPAEFQRRVEQGRFLEYAEVHGHRYGTLRETVTTALRAGKSVLVVVDVQGAGQIREHVRRAGADDPIRQGFMDVFISPPSLDELRKRLLSRAEDTPGVIEKRLHNAKKEMEAAGLYQYRLLNDDLEAAYRRFREIIEKEMSRL